MTMAKKLPILYPSIHTFEILGEFSDYRAKVVLYQSIRKMVDAKRYYQVFYDSPPKNCRIYKRVGGGLTIILKECPEYRKNYIRLAGVNPARIAGNQSRLALTDLSFKGLVMADRKFQEELEQLGILEIEDHIEWRMSRLDMTQDFYVKSNPSLLVKIIRYAGKVKPYGKGHEEHHDQHNEMRSCKFRRTNYDFALYDKHQQLLNCQKKGYFVPPEDLDISRNLVRYEIQLKRPYLKRFEETELHSMELKFKKNLLLFYLGEISELIPSVLRHRASEMFGENAWYSASSAWKAVEESKLDDETKELVRRYIEKANNLEAGRKGTKEFSNREYQEIEYALDELKINEVIIPDAILNERQLAKFPCDALCTRVQDENEQEIVGSI